ncbi:hypothetical protein HQQ80_05775 [Microbacteriaceae bacterium VKM Ac-2855]|nr:hypothetical protein [Microbacteriaceae bacterium VKM Ac-2855]
MTTRTPRWRVALVEAVPVLVVVATAIVILSRFASSAWSAILLYNGDSLVLPLLEKSITAGEPFEWVFSSQLFIFPELMIYGFISLFTDDTRLTIISYVVVNLLLLYTFARLIARFSLQRSRHRFIEISVALIATGLFAVFCLLEPEPNINGSAIASLFLLNTYYQGAVLAGLAALTLVLWVSRGFHRVPWGTVRTIVYVVLAGSITIAATLCDPLYALQITMPLCLAIVAVWFAGRMNWRAFLLLVAVNAGGAVIGLWARRFVAQYLSAEVDAYIVPARIPESISLLTSTLRELLQTPVGTFKLLLLALLVAAMVLFFAYAVFAQARPALRRSITGAEFFLSAMATFSFFSLLAGFVITGSTTTRYLVPIFIFPILALIPIAVHVLRRSMLVVGYGEYRASLARFMIGAAAAASALVVVAGVISLPPVIRMTSGADFTGADCFDDFVDDENINGVGVFWITREWEVYGEDTGDVLQVNGDLSIFDWMINLSSYEDKDFSYVVTDPFGTVTEDSIAPLGEPADVVSCGDFTIYDYAGTPGEKILTDTVAQSLESLQEERGFVDEQ